MHSESLPINRPFDISFLQNYIDRSKYIFTLFSIEGKIALCGVILIFMVALFAPVLSVYLPDKITGSSLEPPGPTHLLGTDELGMDIWSQICYGARMSLVIGLSVACIAGLGGGALGILAGYLGGPTDQLLMRTVDVLMALPSFPLLIVISAFMGPSILNVICVLVLFSWAKPARVARSQTLAIRDNTYIIAAKNFGGTPVYILRRHILPEMLPILFVLIISITSYAIVAETGLAFLGLGDPTSKSWGMMLYYATSFKAIYFTSFWQWWLIPPLVALVFLVLSLAFIGRDLEQVLDPRLRKNGGV
ncbi:MAG: ABC transporter permease [Methanoregula sp.]|jgi:peptide/nickel transport system permease protein|uniref:ABC transporter permease n=1 Tax=Methanoregula sp. TaxID=2052170 RepID=UPI0025DD2F8B|nr:ABC transporter permease [Methanoregula sp.]MCK9632387.1 ABC transporter permease [Methanoregula sp.]